MPSEKLTNARILIVDDHPSNVLLLRKILYSSGYHNVAFTTESREAVEFCRQFQPDIMLLDLHMPYQDGFEVMQQLNNETEPQNSPLVLVITADNDRESRDRALLLGAVDLIGKPFDITALLLRVEEAACIHRKNKRIRQQIRKLKKHEQRLSIAEMQSLLIRRITAIDRDFDRGAGQQLLRISQYAVEVAQSVGLSLEESVLIAKACLTHDITIHPPIRDELLSESDSNLMRITETIALTHNEKWNGTGYPQGLHGEGVPLVGRICAVVEVFDALTTERPNRTLWSVNDAMNYLKAESGKHFDPWIVRLFLDCLPLI